jgi:lysylphosphatidylglycerol synthetase-like protein (DUF2156 family)
MEKKRTRLAGLPTEAGAKRIAMLVIITCAAIALGVAALILTWIVSGDLEMETVGAAAVLFLILAGIIGLSLRGGQRLALIVLSALLFLLVAADLAGYGLHTSMASAFLVPILLLAGGFGLKAGIAAALVCSAYGWILAAGETGGWIAVPYAADVSHLTFDAPALTVIYLLCAIIAGYAVDSLQEKETRDNTSDREGA